jgi:hypothetical protein
MHKAEHFVYPHPGKTENVEPGLGKNNLEINRRRELVLE